MDELNTTQDIWWGAVNVKYSEEKFDALHQRMAAYLRGKTVKTSFRYWIEIANGMD